MEFLMGRSLKTSLFNLNINGMVEDIFKKWDINLDRIYEYEPDAGLGNTKSKTHYSQHTIQALYYLLYSILPFKAIVIINKFNRFRHNSL